MILFSKTIDEVESELRRHEEEEKERKRRTELFYSTYPNFENTSIKYDISYLEVTSLLFKSSDKYHSFIQFQSAMKLYSMDERLEKLHLLYSK